MWLIDCHTYELVYFPSHRGQNYAILSHTWEQNEVTFEQLRSGTVNWKIEKTCEQAIKDGLHYAWVDTCCIDKSSSAELQEAINSMFQWYTKAQICYAYLYDSEDLNSRWFTRGWTLQELIAPRNLVFYSQTWRSIGTKEEMLSTVCDMTKIDAEILTGKESLSTVAAARKMSWACGRQTTRIEDRAYSLLGLFGVSMPLLYGEGAKAFLRLQEEVLRTTPDLSLLLWKSGKEVDQDQGQDDDDIYLDVDENQVLLAASPDEFEHCASFIYALSNSGLESVAAMNISSIGLQARLNTIPQEGSADLVVRDTLGNPVAREMLVYLECFDEEHPLRATLLRTSAIEHDNGVFYLSPRYHARERLVTMNALTVQKRSEPRNVILQRYVSMTTHRHRLRTKSIPGTSLQVKPGGVSHVHLEMPADWKILERFPTPSWTDDFDVSRWNYNDYAVDWRSAPSKSRSTSHFIVGSVKLAWRDTDAVIAFACFVNDIVIPFELEKFFYEVRSATNLQQACEDVLKKIPNYPFSYTRLKRFGLQPSKDAASEAEFKHELDLGEKKVFVDEDVKDIGRYAVAILRIGAETV